MESTTLSTVLSVRSFIVLREVVLCADPSGLCSGPSNLGILLYCQFIISNALAQHSSRHFLSSLDALAGSSPFETFSGAATLLTTQTYIF